MYKSKSVNYFDTIPKEYTNFCIKMYLKYGKDFTPNQLQTDLMALELCEKDNILWRKYIYGKVYAAQKYPPILKYVGNDTYEFNKDFLEWYTS